LVLQPRLLGGIGLCALGAVMFIGSLPRHGITIDPLIIAAIGIGFILGARGGREAPAWRRGQFFMNMIANPNAKTIEARFEWLEAVGALTAVGALASWFFGLLALGWIWLAIATVGLALASIREIAVATGLSKEPKKRERPNLRIVH
jgi:hypothetical protein